MIATLSFASPFQVLMPRPVTLKARNRKAPELGPKVRIEAARLSPPGEVAALLPMINGSGLRDIDKDGFKEHDTGTKSMWCGACGTNFTLEFDLPEPVPLGAIEVWNFNGDWQTTNGLRKADVAVSADGATWQTVLRGAEFAQADGIADYDEPTVLKLKGVTARKVRFENLVPWSTGGNLGLSEVVFHQAAGTQAAPLQPEDGATSISVAKPVLRWLPGEGAKEHQVFLGTTSDKLEALGTVSETHLPAPQLKPDCACFWRVDEVQPDGKIVTGRVARFETTGLVAWWKLDEAKGTKAEDASGHQLTASVSGKASWAKDQGRMGGAMEFDGQTTFLSCGKASEFDFTDGMTVSAWIKVREFNKKWQAIVTKGDTAWRLQRDGEEHGVMFSCDAAKSSSAAEKKVVRVVSRRKVDDGQWHHVVALSDGRRVALYVDGVLEQSADALPIPRNTSSVMIGCNSDAYERRFNGWIDDVRLYGYALSEDQVKALYRSGSETK